MRIRAVKHDDIKNILDLAKKAGIGMTSLPPDESVLTAKIDHAVNSFNCSKDCVGAETFLFVIEDVDKNQIVGTSGIAAHVGMKRPFYSYKLSTITQSSKEVDIYGTQQVLNVVNDYTGASEIGSLFLLPEYRRDRIGSFLSRMRFVFMAEFKDIFDNKVIAELRGVHDKAGNSPFYDSIARHFFQMPFNKADYINATMGNQFITDLMPKYPIYVNLLPKSAQEVIGTPLSSSEPALAMLEREGFHYNNYLDVFDGGPTVEARLDNIYSVKNSRKLEIAKIEDYVEGSKHIIMTAGKRHCFACVGRIRELENGLIAISQRTARLLEVDVSERLRAVEM